MKTQRLFCTSLDNASPPSASVFKKSKREFEKHRANTSNGVRPMLSDRARVPFSPQSESKLVPNAKRILAQPPRWRARKQCHVSTKRLLLRWVENKASDGLGDGLTGKWDRPDDSLARITVPRNHHCAKRAKQQRQQSQATEPTPHRMFHNHRRRRLRPTFIAFHPGHSL